MQLASAVEVENGVKRTRMAIKEISVENVKEKSEQNAKQIRVQDMLKKYEKFQRGKHHNMFKSGNLTRYLGGSSQSRAVGSDGVLLP